MMDIKVGFNNMKASFLHHGGDEFCTCGCEAICANPGHRTTIGPTMSCQEVNILTNSNFDLWSNLLCPKEMG